MKRRTQQIRQWSKNCQQKFCNTKLVQTRSTRAEISFRLSLCGWEKLTAILSQRCSAGIRISWFCEVHLWSEHLEVMAGQPFCGSDKKIVPGPLSHLGPPPPTEGLQRPYGQYTVYTCGRWAECPGASVTPGTPPQPPLLKAPKGHMDNTHMGGSKDVTLCTYLVLSTLYLLCTYWVHKGQIAFLAAKWLQINLETLFLAQNTHMGGGKDVTLGTCLVL